MASVYRPDGRHIYRIQFKDQHGRYRKISSGANDKRVAESLGRKIEEDADCIRVGMPALHPELTAPYLGLVATTRGGCTWKEFRRRFEAEYLSGLRRRTREKACMVFDVFEQEL